MLFLWTVRRIYPPPRHGSPQLAVVRRSRGHLDIAGLESHSPPTSIECMQCSYSCPQSQPEKFQQLSLGACRLFLRSNRRPRGCVRACVHGGVWRSVPHRLTLTLPLAQVLSHTLAPTASPNLVCKGPIRPGQANTTPTRVGTTPIITLVAGRTAHHASLAAAVLWPRGMRIHDLHHCRAYTRDSPTFPSDLSSPTLLLSRPMTSAPPASHLPPRTWTATPTPSPITARILPRRPSAMPERTQGVSPLSLTDRLHQSPPPTCLERD